VLEFCVETLRSLAEVDGRVGWEFVEEISLRVQDAYATLAASCFGSMAERVGRQLLDLAAEDPVAQRLVARVTQQNLADGVGTVREVVARTLAQLRAVGLIETHTGEVLILDPERLAALVGRWR
jgi:CRP/FNR family transcriptional regulator